MRRADHGFIRSLVITLAVFALIIFGACVLVNKIGDASEEAQITTIKNAVRHALITCYAIEGVYPDDIEYLKEHYSLSYNEEKYHVYFYDAFASNVMPEANVILLERSEQ